MEFHRLGYPLFLLAVFAASRLVRGRLVARNGLLLAASLAFYAFADPRYLLLLGAIGGVAFLGAPLLAPRRGGRRRAQLAAILGAALAPLLFFKARGFLTSYGLAAAPAGVPGEPGSVPLLHLTVVLGLSYYTFQAVGYLVDVWRGEVEPERDVLVFGLFLAFFPQILQGPIGRARELFPQWKQVPEPDDRCVSDGLFLILAGALKKVVIGDFLGARLVQPAFTYPTGIGWWGAALGIVGFAFQLYGDFAGYSEMAIGSARVLGVRLRPNFNAPYRSRSITEFWNRWHMSLSTWIRDYLFLPMAGRSGSRGRTLAAAVGAMTLCGLWHGNSLAWVGWGALQGCGLVVHQSFLGAMRRRFALKKKLDASVAVRTIAIACTFAFVCAGLFLVRGGDPALQGVATAGEAWARLGTMARELRLPCRPGGDFFLGWPVLAVLALAIASHALPGSWKLAMAAGWHRVPRLAQGALTTLLVLGLFCVRPDASPFIYTNF